MWRATLHNRACSWLWLAGCRWLKIKIAPRVKWQDSVRYYIKYLAGNERIANVLKPATACCSQTFEGSHYFQCRLSTLALSAPSSSGENGREQHHWVVDLVIHRFELGSQVLLIEFVRRAHFLTSVIGDDSFHPQAGLSCLTVGRST